ncbi:MAG: aminopeptidase [Candidatus Aenigmatarchaeota archaeon]
MLSKSLTKKLAKRVVWSMNMKEGETLLVKGGAHTQELVENIALFAMMQGVHPLITTVSDNFTKSVYDLVSEKYLRSTSKLSLKMVEALDNTISIERPKDPRIFEKISQKKLAAATEGGRLVRKKMDKYNVKWCILGYPTKEMAQKLGVKFSLLKKFIVDGTLVNPKILLDRSEFIYRNLKGAKFVYITDEFGTDLTLRMVDRKIMKSDGHISDNDIKEKDIGLNLPDGEVFTTPIETSGHGILVSPKRTDYFTEKMIENIRLVFENGKLNLQKTTAEKNEKLLKDTIKNCIRIDKRKESVIRTTNFAELGIGLNPIINQIVGYLLTDEKIGGTIHVAIGNNKSFGGKNESCLHWDFITNKGVNLEVAYKNGKKKILIENGKFLIE